jgi:hypothetical protein
VALTGDRLTRRNHLDIQMQLSARREALAVAELLR